MNVHRKTQVRAARSFREHCGDAGAVDERVARRSYSSVSPRRNGVAPTQNVQAAPVTGANTQQLATIEGRVPTPAEYGPGCRFANRCPRADARCTSETPRLRPIGPARLTACHHAEAMA